MAYVNDGYTDMQIGVRLSFFIMSLLITLVYLYTVCKVKNKTRDQMQLVWISIGVVLFNDPTYLISIYKPTLFSSMVSNLWVAVFFILLLKYWLRGVERIKDLSNEEQVLQQNNSNNQGAQGVRGSSLLEKVKSAFFFILLVLVMTLYVMAFLNMQYDPTFSLHTKFGPAIVGLTITVAIFLAIYLIYFLVTLVRNFAFFCSLTISGRWLFVFSLCMQIILIFTMAFGVYSPLYANGSILVFFIALCNLYVWSLIYLNWPMGDDSDNRMFSEYAAKELVGAGN